MPPSGASPSPSPSPSPSTNSLASVPSIPRPPLNVRGASASRPQDLAPPSIRSSSLPTAGIAFHNLLQDTARQPTILQPSASSASVPAPPVTSIDATSNPALFRFSIHRRPLPSTALFSPSSTLPASSPFPAPSNIQLPDSDSSLDKSAAADGPTVNHNLSSTRASKPLCGSPPAEAREPTASPGPCQSPSGSTRRADVVSAHLSGIFSAYSDLLSQDGHSTPDPACGQDPDSVASYNDALSHYVDDNPSSPPDLVNENDNGPLAYAVNDLPPSPSPPLIYAPKPTLPHLRLDHVDQSIAPNDNHFSPDPDFPPQVERSDSSSQYPKPPSRPRRHPSPFASLFGWVSPSPSITELSSIPPAASPIRKGSSKEALLARNIGNPSPETSDAAQANPIGYCESYLTTPPPPQTPSSSQVDEMEEELKAISSELAASIRREMDLEDLVDRLQEHINNPQAQNRRTSDYFSDSGYSSAKQSEYEHNREEIEKLQRRAEQEKAQIRLDLGCKLQDERSRRKALDQQIKELAEKASQIDLAQMNSLDANDRVKSLERTCEDLRRKLSEERQSKSNFEDLLSALKGELQNACNERDNLRDEVVPQLRARVEGLESEAVSYSNLTYESTKMQQQLQSLQQENVSLRNLTSAARQDPEGARSMALPAASLSLQKHSAFASPLSDSTKSAQTESREALADRLKDVEAQRDALHNALRNLLERQEFQDRENQKKIRALESERQRLLLGNPKKAGFEREMSNLRTEMTMLRRRAEEALEQKWQVEKGLVGLKTDLDRAEEEIATLRRLLQEKDILIPPPLASQAGSPDGTDSAVVTSESLRSAYRALQDIYRGTTEHSKPLEVNQQGHHPPDEKSKMVMQRLEESLSAAVLERDEAKRQAESLQDQVENLTESESKGIGRERALADELNQSAEHVEQLAARVRQQLASNADLRDRLSETVARGDAERAANSTRICQLQERLHVLEEQLIVAQMASEERVGRHEEELSQLREAHKDHLRRLQSDAGSEARTAAKPSLLKPGSVSLIGRLTAAMPAKSLEDEVEIKTLRTRVAELEKALTDADEEIQQIVAKMNMAQIEVLNLQEEREAAVRETRRLQRTLESERSMNKTCS